MSSTRNSSVLVDTLATKLDISPFEVLRVCRELGIITSQVLINAGTRIKPRFVRKSTLTSSEAAWVESHITGDAENSRVHGTEIGPEQYAMSDFGNGSGALSTEFVSSSKSLKSKTQVGITLSNDNLQDADYSNTIFIDCDISGVDFSHATLTNAKFENSRIYRCSFSGASLENVVLDRSRVNGTLLDGALLRRLTVLASDVRASFVGADLSQSTWDSSSAAQCDFSDAIVRKSSFQRTSLRDSNFDGADLRETKMIETDLKGSSFVRVKHDGLQIQDCHLDGGIRAHFNKDGSPKSVFRTQKDANEAIQTNREFRDSSLVSYKCSMCGAWHFGHSSRR